MPAALLHPGVYIEEIPSGVRAITGVATSITAFLGRARRGPANEAKVINSFADFERTFGGLWAESRLGYSVRDYFLNGGSQAVIVRLYRADSAKPDPAKITLAGIELVAASPGKWGAYLRVSIDSDGVTAELAASLGVSRESVFNLTVTDSASGRNESFANVTVVASARQLDKVLAAESKLLRVKKLPAADATSPVAALVTEMGKLAQARTALATKLAADPTGQTAVNERAAVAAAEEDVEEEKQKLRDPVSAAEAGLAAARKKLLDKQISDPTNAAAEQTAVTTAQTALDQAKTTFLGSVSDGQDLSAAEFLPSNGQDLKQGLFALEQVDLFNLLCIPPYKKSGDAYDVDLTVVAQATSYCERKRAMYLIDAPSNWNDKDAAKAGFTAASNDFPGVRSKNAALFFPRIRQPNPLRDDRVEEFTPSGAIAGVFARTDVQRGVWKAPAGLDAALIGVPELEQNLTDAENGELNPLGINCLRAFPLAGRVVWGARTLRGADQLADEWKYIPVRRTALFIEESLYRGTQWVVFEPNDEPLWASIRLNVGAFMNGLFRQGAFQGQTPRDAYFVKCDKETTTQDDVNLGIVNIVVGFAPLKPAEFVVIKLQQMAGQTQA